MPKRLLHSLCAVLVLQAVLLCCQPVAAQNKPIPSPKNRPYTTCNTGTSRIVLANIQQLPEQCRPSHDAVGTSVLDCFKTSKAVVKDCTVQIKPKLKGAKPVCKLMHARGQLLGPANATVVGILSQSQYSRYITEHPEALAGTDAVQLKQQLIASLTLLFGKAAVHSPKANCLPAEAAKRDRERHHRTSHSTASNATHEVQTDAVRGPAGSNATANRTAVLTNDTAAIPLAAAAAPGVNGNGSVPATAKAAPTVDEASAVAASPASSDATAAAPRLNGTDSMPATATGTGPTANETATAGASSASNNATAAAAAVNSSSTPAAAAADTAEATAAVPPASQRGADVAATAANSSSVSAAATAVGNASETTVAATTPASNSSTAAPAQQPAVVASAAAPDAIVVRDAATARPAVALEAGPVIVATGSNATANGTSSSTSSSTLTAAAVQPPNTGHRRLLLLQLQNVPEQLHERQLLAAVGDADDDEEYAEDETSNNSKQEAATHSKASAARSKSSNANSCSKEEQEEELNRLARAAAATSTVATTTTSAAALFYRQGSTLILQPHNACQYQFVVAKNPRIMQPDGPRPQPGPRQQKGWHVASWVVFTGVSCIMGVTVCFMAAKLVAARQDQKYSALQSTEPPGANTTACPTAGATASASTAADAASAVMSEGSSDHGRLQQIQRPNSRSSSTAGKAAAATLQGQICADTEQCDVDTRHLLQGVIGSSSADAMPSRARS